MLARFWINNVSSICNLPVCMRTMTQTKAAAYIDTMAQYLKDLIILHPETVIARITTCPCIFPPSFVCSALCALGVFPFVRLIGQITTSSPVTIKSVSHFDAPQ